MTTVIVDGKQMSYEEWRKLELAKESQEFSETRKLQREAQELLGKIGEAYKAYKAFMRAHPQLAVELPEDQVGNQQFYEELQQNLERADEAPRCLHIKADGVQCGSPRMKTGDLCFAHQRMANAQSLKLRLTAYEDPNGIQIALQETSGAMLDGKITPKVAGLLFYGLQTATRNVARVTFNQTAPEKVVREETQVRAAGQVVQIDERRLSYEKYRYENMDEDLRTKLHEIGVEMDRRDLIRMKAAQGLVPESVAVGDEGGVSGQEQTG